jgi:hypothetical protein
LVSLASSGFTNTRSPSGLILDKVDIRFKPS